MKLQGLARLSIALALAACSPGRDGAVSVVESAEIGVCGANADPVTGVICTGHFWASNSGWASFGSSEAFEKNGKDWVKCTWNTSCSRWYTAASDSGVACNSVIGTGCPANSTISGTLFLSWELPVGTQANQLDAYCKKFEPAFGTVLTECQKNSSVIEQYEDLCCVPRQPKPDGGVSTDAGTDAGTDASVDAGTDAGYDAGTDAGYDAGIDAGWDAGIDAGWDAGIDAGTDAGTDAGYDAQP